MKGIIASGLTLLVCVSLSCAATLHVPSEYSTIQLGIDAATDGDTVLVAAGVYFENIDFSGKEIAVISADGAAATHIDGQAVGSVVRIATGEGPGTLLEGFTLKNGESLYDGSSGIRIASGAFPTIRGNIIDDNGAIWGGMGGGISIQHADAIIEYNQITNNECIYYGGSVILEGSVNSVIRHNTMAGNWLGSGYGVSVGVGIFLQSGYLSVENNIIVNNTGQAPSYGGGLYVMGAGVCTNDFNDVWNNTPPDYVGCTAGSGGINADPLFVGGQPYDYSLNEDSPCIDAGAFTSPPDADGTRTDVGAYYFDQEGINIALVAEEWPLVIPSGGGSFEVVVHVTNHTSTTAEFDIWIDVQTPDGTIVSPLILREGFSFAPAQRLERALIQPVPGGILAGQYVYIAQTGDFASSEIYCETRMPFTVLTGTDGSGRWAAIGWEDDAPTAPADFDLAMQAYPDPFNPVTTLTFNLPAAGEIALKIFNLSGQEVAVLAQGQYSAGLHTCEFDGTHLASGLYLARLTTRNMSVIKRLLLLK